MDARDELGLDGIALGELIREVNNTVYSELRRRARLSRVDAGELVAMPGPRQTTYLDGHPKLLANKGRVGWGDRALARYAPEAGEPLRLRWLAIRPERCRRSLADDVAWTELTAEALAPEARAELRRRAADEGLDPEASVLVPVHPWQFQRYVRTQYAGALARGRMVDLGPAGDDYLPQQSIRSLVNVSRPGRADVKLSLTILNTSCYRGIPGGHLEAGVALSRWLSRRASKDPALADLAVLRQRGSVHVPHRTQERVDEGPYRFREMLGAVWRESLQARLAPDEQGILLSALMQTD
ncbi:MAG: IucA/IucC family protein, partial [Proteobacteria bacterium SW_6_67_9]